MSNNSAQVTRPFDEDTYPRLHLTRQQLDVIALAREMYPKPIRTKLVAKRLGCTFNQAYKVLRRLRDKGVFHSYLRWITLPNGPESLVLRPKGSGLRATTPPRSNPMARGDFSPGWPCTYSRWRSGATSLTRFRPAFAGRIEDKTNNKNRR